MNRFFLLILIVLLSSTINAQDLIETDSIIENLGEIEIIAHRKLVKHSIGKIEYDVKGDNDACAMSVMDILKKVPMVIVDANDEISINGSKDFVIYKNGKPSGLFTKNPKETLNSMSAGLVKRIEVITDPGAQYDAEGINGILNIIMDERSVIDGVVGTARGVSNIVGMYSGTINLTTQTGNVTIEGNYGYNRYGEKQQLTKDEMVVTYKDSGNTLSQKDRSVSTGCVHNIGLSASWEIDSLNLATISIDGQLMQWKYKSMGSSEMFSPNGEMSYKYDIKYDYPPYNSDFLNVRADFQHKTQLRGEVLSFSYLLSRSENKMAGNVYYDNKENVPISYSSMGMSQDAVDWEHTFQADYVRPVASKMSLNVGAKYIMRRNQNETRYLYDDGQCSSSDFEHYSHIGALYGEYSININRWQARAGLRYEYSRLGGEYFDGSNPNFHRDLNDWVPTLGMNFLSNDANSFTLNYNMRIKRPSITRLNPSVSESPISVSTGNPYLVSANQHNISFGHMYNSQRLTLNTSLRYTMIDDTFMKVNRVVDDVIYSTYANVGRYMMYAIQGYIQWSPLKKTQLMANYGLYYQMAENKAMNITLNRWRIYCRTQLTQQLPWKLRLILTGGHNGGDEITPYSYQEGCYFYSFGLQRSFLKEDRLSVRFDAYNPFSESYYDAPTQIVNGDYTGISIEKYRNKMIKLTIAYRFGSLNARVKSTSKTITNDDVM